MGPFELLEAAGPILRIDSYQQLRRTEVAHGPQHVRDSLHDPGLTRHMVSHTGRVDDDRPRGVSAYPRAEILSRPVGAWVKVRVELGRSCHEYLVEPHVPIDVEQAVAER